MTTVNITSLASALSEFVLALKGCLIAVADVSAQPRRS
jgi:hypothetical protein